MAKDMEEFMVKEAPVQFSEQDWPMNQFIDWLRGTYVSSESSGKTFY